MSTRTALPPARYEYGGDEFVFVEIDREMSIEANFKAMMITNELAARELDGIVDVCGGQGLLQIRLLGGRQRGAEHLVECLGHAAGLGRQRLKLDVADDLQLLGRKPRGGGNRCRI